jgi:hypothetical protein
MGLFEARGQPSVVFIRPETPGGLKVRESPQQESWQNGPDRDGTEAAQIPSSVKSETGNRLIRENDLYPAEFSRLAGWVSAWSPLFARAD